MKKFLLLIIPAFVLMSCGDEIPQHHKTIRSGRTILAYFVANNNLDDAIMGNLLGMYEGLSNMTDSSTLLIFYKPLMTQKGDSPTSQNFYIPAPSILKFETDGHGRINNKPALLGTDLNKGNVIAQATVLRTYPNDMNSLNPDNMEKILRYMVDDVPSKTYGLVFGSHATSWLPAGNASRSFGQDARKEINIPEFAAALSKVFSQESLDFILWDACMMATVEVTHQFKDVTKYVIGSVMESPLSGFPYKNIMNGLYAENIPFVDICRETIKYFEESDWGTVSAMDCRQIDQLATFIHSNHDLFDIKVLTDSVSYIQQYGATTYYTDFSRFSFDVIDTFEKLSSEPVPNDLLAIMNQLVVAKECLEGEKYKFNNVVLEKEHYSGTGMYLPILNVYDKWDEYYKTLSWYKAAGWDELMD